MEQPAETCLLLLSGLPAAGKTSLARSLAREASGEDIEVRHVCFDELGCQPCSRSGGGGGSGTAEATDAFSPEAWQLARRAALAQLERELAGSSSSSRSSDPVSRQQQQPRPAGGVQQGAASGTSADPDATAEQQQGSSRRQKQRLVIADDNLQYRSMRWQCYGLARAAGAAVFLLHLRCSEPLAQARNAQRPVAERVPPAVISRMAAQFEAPGSGSSNSSSTFDGGYGGSGSGSGSSSSIAAWERSCLVECSAEQPIDPAAVWQQVRCKWGAPAPRPFDAAAAAAERAAAQAATAASRAHATDLATRQVLSQSMQRLASAAPAARAAAAQQLNTERRQVLQEAAAEQQAAAPDEPSSAAERWAAAFQQRCNAILASLI